MLFVQLDCNWPDNEKVMDAGWEAAGVHAGIMCLAKRLDSDGWVPLKMTRRYEMPDDVIDRLVKLDLLERDEDRVRPHDWHDRNPSKAEITAKRAAKVKAGKAGNHARYGHHGDVDSCEICNPSRTVRAGAIAGCEDEVNTQVMDVLANGSQVPSHTSRYIDRDTAATAPCDDEQVATNRAGIEQLRGEIPWLRSELAG